MKTIVKITIAFLAVIFVVLLVVNYFKSQPDLMAFFDDIYTNAESIEDVLENTLGGMKAVIEYIGSEISSFFAR